MALAQARPPVSATAKSRRGHDGRQMAPTLTPASRATARLVPATRARRRSASEVTPHYGPKKEKQRVVCFDVREVRGTSSAAAAMSSVQPSLCVPSPGVKFVVVIDHPNRPFFFLVLRTSRLAWITRALQSSAHLGITTLLLDTEGNQKGCVDSPARDLANNFPIFAGRKRETAPFSDCIIFWTRKQVSVVNRT
ncbi:hypothetical protein HPB51_010571 [Rhipicephalus microplus]|uniref:Uncharacterized protein n=1 Tax=Rhipicephalus microplus TaxID=6941 RepID=A0A9J6E983_RHIMP|nr:hypothetical protein HPB51_010571 [Rhipicephalus microplus]